MNKCKRCNVWVADDTMVCPLCHTILTEEKSKGQKSGSGFPDSEFEYNGARYVDIDSVADKRFLIQGPGYPDVKKNTRRFRKAGRILLFISLALEMLLVFINYLTFDMAPKYWSVVTGGIIAYLILTMWDIFSRRQGHIRKIYTQIFVILGLMILIDFALDWSGWSLEFGLPCIIYGLVLAIISVDYRVAPEDPYPAALEDAYAAYQWLLEMGCRGSQIIVAGDSAGGGLALALCLYLKDKGEPLPKKLVLMSPWTDLAATGDSYETNFEKDPLFGNTTDSMIYSNAYYGENDPKTPYISPLYGNYEGFPPMLFQVGGSEMLLSDSARAAKKAKAAGCEVQLTIYDEMFHVFQLGMKKMKESREAWKEIEEFLTI